MEPFKNIYHLRKVAQSNSKPCAFCYKITDSVLITSDGSVSLNTSNVQHQKLIQIYQSDFFFTCDSHLKDAAFASPIYDKEYNEAKAKKEALDKEIKALKLKWDEKNRYAGWDKLVSKFSSTKKDGKDDDKKDEKDSTSKSEETQIKELSKQVSNHESILQKQPRTYQLNKDIFKIRLEKKYKSKQSVQSTQLNQKLKDPTFFPSVPQGPPNT